MATITITATQLSEALVRALDVRFGKIVIDVVRGKATIVRQTHILKAEDLDKLVTEIQTT